MTNGTTTGRPGPGLGGDPAQRVFSHYADALLAWSIAVFLSPARLMLKIFGLSAIGWTLAILAEIALGTFFLAFALPFFVLSGAFRLLDAMFPAEPGAMNR